MLGHEADQPHLVPMLRKTVAIPQLTNAYASTSFTAKNLPILGKHAPEQVPCTYTVPKLLIVVDN
jgi:hypothetical protein